MRTKVLEGVLRLEVTQWEPRPFVYLVYDGLAGLGQRPILRDLVDELERKGPGKLKEFLDRLKSATVKTADISVYFDDYVSYGLGGGDATAENYYRTLLLVYMPKSEEWVEYLALERPGGWERLRLDDLVA